MADLSPPPGPEKGAARKTYAADPPIEDESDDRFSHSDYVEVLHTMVRDAETPFNVGVYGKWGIGKSSVLKMLKSRLDRESDDFSCVWIDAWGLSANMLKHGISMAVGEKTDRYKREEKIDEIMYSVKEEKATGRWATAFNVAMLATVGIAIVNTWEPIFGRGAMEGSETLTTVVSLAAAAGLVVWKSLVTYKSRTRPASISTIRFKNSYNDLVGEIKKDRKKSHKLVIIVDNLDRCESRKAVDILGIIQTFMTKKGCVNVVACDSDAIKRHLSRIMHYEDGKNTGGEFLEKFFQATISIQETHPTNLREYVGRILRERGLDHHPNLAHVLLAGAATNPRKIGMYVNDLTARLHLAEIREGAGRIPPGAVTGNPAFLAKLVIIEHEWPDTYRDLEDMLLQDPLDAKDTGMKEDRRTRFLVATTDIKADDMRPFLRLGAASHDLESVSNEFCNAVFLNDVGGARRILDEARPEDHPHMVARVREDVQIERQRPGSPAVQNCVRVMPRVVDMLSGEARSTAISVISTCIDRFAPKDRDDESTILNLLPEMPGAEGVFRVITGRHFEGGAFDPGAWRMLMRNRKHMPPSCAKKLDAALAEKISASKDDVLGFLTADAEGQDWIRDMEDGGFWDGLIGTIEFSGEEADQAKVSACKEAKHGKRLSLHTLLAIRFADVAARSGPKSHPPHLYAVCGQMEHGTVSSFISAAIGRVAEIGDAGAKKNAIYHTIELDRATGAPVPAPVGARLAVEIAGILRDEGNNGWATSNPRWSASRYFSHPAVVSALCDNVPDRGAEVAEIAFVLGKARGRSVAVAVEKLEAMSSKGNISDALAGIVGEPGSEQEKRYNNILIAWIREYCSKARPR